jgi:hypothetical protein
MTGAFIWLVAYRKPACKGRLATRAYPNGYLFIKMGGRSHSASRLAWELTRGAIPIGLEIDHINRVRDDNRIANLRLVTRAENLANRTLAPNMCGSTGVSLHKKSGLYRARHKDRVKYAATIEEAAKLYEELTSTKHHA